MEKYIYRARLDRVIDGDTVDAFIDLGFDTHIKRRIRFQGLDTWESRTRNKEEKKSRKRKNDYVDGEEIHPKIYFCLYYIGV